VHFTIANGDSVSYRFTGTGLQMLSETNDDAGTADVYVDGTKVSTVDAYGMPRLAQQPIVSITGLRKGDHTVRVVKTGGSYLVVDGFTVIPDDIAPARDITVRGITFEYSSWIEPNRTGYVDNQAGVLWNPVTHKPVRIPAAIQVHRGQRVTFDGVTVAHTGGSGIDLADQTRDSTVTNATISDTGGGGVAIGEVDDYYQTEPALMTSGNTVTRTEITHPGRQYADAVGIWTGITRGTTLSHNEVGYTPYSGMSIGWGWGWASDCTLQAKQGLPVPCRHGTTYNGDIHVLNNHVHSVMGALFDGGPIYTNGGSASASEFAGNVLSECIDGCNMIYHDEGSALWDTHDNLVRFGNGSLWTNLWTPSIHDDHIHDNFSDTAAFNNSGTNIDFEQATVVTGGRWPPAAQAIIAAAGTGRPPGTPADDDDLRIAYAGTWSSSGSRGLGDLDDGVHYTTTDGDSATFTFAGAAVSLLTETNADEGDIAITLDGTAVGTVSAYSATRAARQAVYSASGLGAGRHTLTVTKAGGTYLLVDGFGAG
jgi:hypothetical protein